MSTIKLGTATNYEFWEVECKLLDPAHNGSTVAFVVVSPEPGQFAACTRTGVHMLAFGYEPDEYVIKSLKWTKRGELDCSCCPGYVCPPCTEKGYTSGLSGYAERMHALGIEVTAEDEAAEQLYLDTRHLEAEKPPDDEDDDDLLIGYAGDENEGEPDTTTR